MEPEQLAPRFPDKVAPKSGDWRMQVVVLEADHARGTRHTFRVTFEEMSYPMQQEDTAAPSHWIPCNWGDDLVRQKLKIVFPWWDRKDPGWDWAKPYLDWMRHVAPGVWDFSVCTESLD